MKDYPRITEIPMGDVAWSLDNREDWRHETLRDLLQWVAPTDMAGKVVYVADKERPSASAYMPDADCVIDEIINTAWDEGGDYADDYPDVSDEAKAKLNALLEAWADEHLPAPTWWQCVNIREYVITQADIDEARK